ncbi:hypothetical protein AB6A23_12960 [Paenibacillus tarimensis]
MDDTDSRVTSAFKTGRASLSVYFAAGISITRKNDVFQDAMKDIERRCHCEGINRVRINTFYPYGYIDDVPVSRHKRFIFGQAAVVFADMLTKASMTSGGQSLYHDIRKDYDADGGGNIVLIGHSGGGVASYKAGLLLEEAGYPVSDIIMVGSPKIPIRKTFRDRVYALEHSGRWGDLVCRIGFHLFRPPRDRVRLPIVDGHPSYFCNESKDENDVSNMSKVLDTIWGWLQPTAR